MRGNENLREEYEELKLETIRFTSADVISTSREYDEELDGEYVEE